MTNIALFIGKSISWISKFLHFGAGATWPGEMTLRISPAILSRLQTRISKGIIIVAGTNGKTTTSLMIRKILEDKEYAVLHNQSGANLLNGVVSAFFTDKRKMFDYAVFEVDENALPSILSYLKTTNHQPRISIVLLNLFRDQLDRYGEVDSIADHWKQTLQNLGSDTTVIINADDPQLAFIGASIKKNILYFGLDNKTYYVENIQHATDSTYCPSCSEKLIYKGVYYSHLGDWDCPKCPFTHPILNQTSKEIDSPLEGVYNLYNTVAATALAKQLGISSQDITASIKGFLPAFGRMEEIIYKGKQIKILLSKNPTGFNESLRTMRASPQHGPMLLLLNDRIPDGTDVSWIWDVDFEVLAHDEYKIIVSGDRALDMALRLKYGGLSYEVENKHARMIIEENIQKAVDRFVETIGDKETGWVLATYSAMLDVRKILTGRKIL